MKVRDTGSGSESTLPYDKLVLATGGRAVRPPIAGIDAEGVQSFHSLGDAGCLSDLLSAGSVKKVVLVGAGLIGIELAEALVERGLTTLVVLAVLNSALSLYYYLRVVVVLYMRETDRPVRA